MQEKRRQGKAISEMSDGMLRNVLSGRLYYFFLAFWEVISSEKLVISPHLEVVCDELEAIGRRIIARKAKKYDLIINIPPGMSKSSMCSQIFPAWLWIHDPSLQIISTSHSIGLSMENALKSKDIILSDKYQQLFGDKFKIRYDIKAKSYYKNDKGGFRFASSIGSAIVGRHAHLILIDDPVSPTPADMDLKCATANYHIDNILSQRTVSAKLTPLVMIMQRVQRNDPTGVWLARAKIGGQKVRHICLPAVSTYPVFPAELRAIYKNGVLEPVRFGLPELATKKAKMGTIDYVLQFGQQAMEGEGNMVKKKWLPVVRYERLPNAVKEKVRHFVADMADGENENNDKSAWLAYCEYRGYLFIFGYEFFKGSFPERVKAFEAFIRKNANGPVASTMTYIEPKSSGKAVYQFMRDYVSDIPVQEWVMERGSKPERLKVILPSLEVGKCFLVDGVWNFDFLEEILMFPKGGVEDEAADLLTMAGVNTWIRGVVQAYDLII